MVLARRQLLELALLVLARQQLPALALLVLARQQLPVLARRQMPAVVDSLAVAVWAERLLEQPGISMSGGPLKGRVHGTTDHLSGIRAFQKRGGHQ